MIELFAARESLVSDIPAEDGKIGILFYSVSMGDGWLSMGNGWVGKLLRKLSGFKSRHLSKTQNVRHKQRRGQHTPARKKVFLFDVQNDCTVVEFQLRLWE
jgi:hypothetical protein